jgi:malate synthase
MAMRNTIHSLQVDAALAAFVNDEVLPGTGVEPAAFWAGFDAIVRELAPKNAALLAERDRLQAELKREAEVTGAAMKWAHERSAAHLKSAEAEATSRAKPRGT